MHWHEEGDYWGRKVQVGGKRLGERIREEDLLKQCIIQNTIMK